MKYLVTKVEQTKTSTGKDMYKSTLKSAEGVDETINLFDKVIEGESIEGEIYTNDKGYRNFKSAQKAAASTFAGNQKSDQVRQAQDHKAEHIREAQDRKEESIAWFNSRNLAIIFVEKYVHNPAVSSPTDALLAVRDYTETFFKDWQNWSEKAF